jgi:serpin B
MFIFLPAPKSNLNDFLDSVNAENWENWMTQFREQEKIVEIPKFKLEYGTKELNDALTTLGMGVAFDENRADFSRMASLETLGGNLYIEKVAHKTFIEVNEEGSEAAAVTSVGVGVKSLPRPFTVDRPFFFAIRDKETGTVLFMGTVVEP